MLADLGIDKGRSSTVGGPFVPIKPPQSGASAFERQLYHINVVRAHMSSPFGIRMDPFLGRPAVHTGIDLRGDVGEPVRATATGHVTVAGRKGGYGNMVEISHGNGFVTRYGHLSVITVKIGQIVRIGEVVGRFGSTGRSTGPHLRPRSENWVERFAMNVARQKRNQKITKTGSNRNQQRSNSEKNYSTPSARSLASSRRDERLASPNSARLVIARKTTQTRI
ncbi:MAG: M23 family metallopeptidase [Pseudolabrys sp.]